MRCGVLLKRATSHPIMTLLLLLITHRTPQPTLVADRTISAMLLRQAHGPRIHRASPVHLLLFPLDKLHWALGRGGDVIAENQQAGLASEVRVDIFQRSARRFGVQEVGERYEGAVQNGPDDVKLPGEVLDADLGDFDDHATVGLGGDSSDTNE